MLQNVGLDKEKIVYKLIKYNAKLTKRDMLS